MPFSLSEKTCVVTGGASGIGYAICELFAAQGGRVYVLDLNLGAAEKACGKIDGIAIPVQVDVADEASVASAFKTIRSDSPGSRIDVLVNNAGIAAIGDVTKCTQADMDRVYSVNVLGVFHCLKQGVNAMLETNTGGAIVNLASIASVIGLKDRFAYSMSKGAVLTMTYSVATDYVKQNIRCNAVCPARIHTPFVDGYLKRTYPGKEAEMFKVLSDYQPIGRMGKPAEVAALILYLVSDEAKFVTGAAYPVDGGVTCRM